MSQAKKTGKTARWISIGLLLVLTIGLATTLARFGMAFAGGSDASGYVHNSKLLVEGRLHGDVRPVAGLPTSSLNPYLYQPLGFNIDPSRASQTPTYPFGLPLVFSVFRLLSNSDAAILFGIILIGISTPIAVYLLSRTLALPEYWSVLAATIVGLSPLYLFMSLSPMSDVLSASLATWCIYFALLSHKRLPAAIALGVCFSLELLTRIPNVFIALPIGFILICRLKEQRRWWAIIASSLPGIAFLLWLNNHLYGSPLTSGYGDVSQLFRVEYFGMTISHFSHWLAALHTPVVAVAFIISVAFARKSPFKVAILWLWATPFVVFYAFYYYSHETWWYLRFILPALPPMAIGATLSLERLSKVLGNKTKLAWIPIPISALLLAYIAHAELMAGKGKVHYLDPNSDSYAQLKDWMKGNVHPDDEFLTMQTSGCIYYYQSNPIIRYDWLKDGDWTKITRSMNGRPGDIYAPLFPFEIEGDKVLTEKAPGDWTEVAKLGDLRIFKLAKSESPVSRR